MKLFPSINKPVQPVLLLLVAIAISSVCLVCGQIDDARAAAAGPLSSGNASQHFEPTGAIAYVRNGSEIRLIDSTGGNDRKIWSHPNAKQPFGIFDLAWRPDGGELAFSSGHENMFSIYHADLYCIRPDGSGYRKITNAPDHKRLGSFKKGTVTITLRNTQPIYLQAESSVGVFTVYIAGAEEPQGVVLPPGTTRTLVFKNVADYGDHPQPVVAISGHIRWMMPAVDVVAGKTIKAPDFNIQGDGYTYLGAFNPRWKSDGSRISFRDGYCLVKSVPAHSNPGYYTTSLFDEKEASLPACIWDWGPSAALSDKVLYSDAESEEGGGFHLGNEGGKHGQATLLTRYTTLKTQPNDVHWLPDGSGFLYSYFTNYFDVYHDETKKIGSNIFRYDLKTKKTTQVTNLSDGFANRFAVSPDGQWIVYEKGRLPADEDVNNLWSFRTLIDIDLWMIKIDGTGERLLVKNAESPSWSR
ncbi:MAG TPA: hypothetical protein VD993_19060 [Chitinophagaceae bacterium]|nr:hypothetical protein [Chitinophagaceae bacterium]